MSINDPFDPRYQIAGGKPTVGGGGLGYDVQKQQYTIVLNKQELRRQAGELYRQLILQSFGTVEDVSNKAEKAADEYYNYLTKEYT